MVPIPPSVSVNPLLHPPDDPNAGLDVFLIAYGFIFKLNPLSGAFRGQSFIVRLVCTLLYVLYERSCVFVYLKQGLSVHLDKGMTQKNKHQMDL